MSDLKNLPYTPTVLVFLKNSKEQFLLLHRKKAPNKDFWTPIGGKIEVSLGESPYECAIRETKEEAGLDIGLETLHLFSFIAEKNYEARNHYLLFLFTCSKPIDYTPQSITEGDFHFFERKEIDSLPLPLTDQIGLWKTYDKYHNSFIALKADCSPEADPVFEVEEVH